MAGVISYLFKDGSVWSFLKANAWNVCLTIATGSIGALLIFQDEKMPIDKDLPIGTVLASSLDATEFLKRDNSTLQVGVWIPADGRSIPADSKYAIATGANTAPNLSSLSNSLVLMQVLNGQVESGTKISTLIDPGLGDATWDFHFALRDIRGSSYNRDYEQAPDQFQIIPGSDSIVAQGRTYNFKHNRWGSWEPGSVNYIGLATDKVKLFYYVRID